jgi:hypothetical protein
VTVKVLQAVAQVIILSNKNVRIPFMDLFFFDLFFARPARVWGYERF